MKTSKIPKQTIDSIKELLLANNSSSNKLGINLAQSHGWELCDIANIVIRNEIKQDDFNISIDFCNHHIAILDSWDWNKSSSLICRSEQVDFDSVMYKKDLTQYHFNKAIGILIKELVRLLKK